MDQSAAAIVCLMSPPANGRRAFTYMCTTCLSDAIIIYLNYSFSLTQQPPIWEPPSHYSMGKTHISHLAETLHSSQNNTLTLCWVNGSQFSLKSLGGLRQL